MKPDRTSTIPLYIQIREELRENIAAGLVGVGERLPPVTALAAEKNVTAATVRRALQDLIEEGLVTSHVGRGTFVADPHSPVAGESTIKVAPRRRADESVLAASRLRQSVTRSLNDLLGLAQKPGVIAFTRGIGDPDTLEKGILTRLAQKALSNGEELFWDYGDPRGLLSLRTAIAALYRERGLPVSPEQVLVTSGSQQAVALVAQQAAEDNTTVICETPCYTGVTNAFSAFAVPLETVERDADGPDLANLPSRIDPAGALLYLCPVLHNPMGTDISEDKQKAAALWARANGATLLSDEIFRDLHPGDKRPLSFLQDPGPERAIVLGSLSKSFISGLRVGWIVTSEERIKTLTRIKKAMDLGCPPLMQGIALAFLEDAEGYRAHRVRIRAHYKKLRDTALDALGTFMPAGVTWTRPQGGFQLWVTLPAHCSSVELFMRSVEKGAAFLPGPLQDMDSRFINSFRLCYGSLGTEEITEGIRRLSQAVREYLDESPETSGASYMGDF